MSNLVVGARQEAKLIAAIAAEHQACCESASKALEHALACGDLLAEAKAGVGHGEWQSWLATHFPATPQTARAYMRLAANRDQIEAATKGQNESALSFSIRDAVKLLAPPKLPTPLDDRKSPKILGQIDFDEEPGDDLPPLGGMAVFLLRCRPDCIAQLVPAGEPRLFHVSVWSRGESGEFDAGAGTLRPVYLDGELLQIQLEALGVAAVESWEPSPAPVFPHPARAA